MADVHRAPLHGTVSDLQDPTCESEVTFVLADVSYQEDTTLLSINGKLDGVLHAAGVLRDAVLHKQTPKTFREVLAGKVSPSVLGSYPRFNNVFNLGNATIADAVGSITSSGAFGLIKYQQQLCYP